jgi:hypothetical protein
VSVAQAWTWPVDGPVLRPFVFDHEHPYAAGQHRGVDLGARSGANVLAPVDGTVSFAGTVPTGGKTISIQTPSGYTATLVHLGSIGVSRGAAVDEGSAVGTVGPSGVVDLTEPYVYFGVRVTADEQGYVDPLTLLPPRAASKAPPAPAETPAAVSPAVVSPAVVSPAAVSPAADAPAAPVASSAPAAPATSETVVAQPEPVRPHAPATVPATPAVPALAAAPAAEHASNSELAEADTPEIASAASPNHEAARSLSDSQRHHALAESAPRARDHAERSTRADSTSRRFTRLPRPRREQGEATATTAASSHASNVVPLAVALVTFVAGSALALTLRRRGLRKATRIMSLPELEHVVVGAAKTEEDPRRTGVAVRGRETSPRPRGRVRSAGGHLRALPPSEGQRRPDGERHGRTWDAGHGHGGSRRRLAA